MARLDSLSILNTSEGKDKLAEAYGKVIDNIAKTTISSQLKNQDLSGDPQTGTVEAKRFVNTGSKPYGTARSGGGNKLKAEPVVISLNTDRELINEVEQKDTALYGVGGLITRKSGMDEKSMQRELERAFFQKAVDAGTDATLTGVTVINEWLEQLIQKIENTKNDFIDGVDRAMIAVVLDTNTYGKVRTYLDSTQNANVNTGTGEFGMFHGVKVYSSVYLPVGTNAVAMCEGSIAQPVLTWLDDAGKIPMTNIYHFGMFYSYGTEAVMPELIYKANFTGAAA